MYSQKRELNIQDSDFFVDIIYREGSESAGYICLYPFIKVRTAQET